MPVPPTPFAERLANNMAIDHAGCWIWIGWCNYRGYGCVTVQGRTTCAHRWVYEHLVGPIPVGLQLDHLCRVTRCVNPDHLEPVTNAENRRRARAAQRLDEACRRGHPRGDFGVLRDGRWRCRECDRLRKLARMGLDPRPRLPNNCRLCGVDVGPQNLVQHEVACARGDHRYNPRSQRGHQRNLCRNGHQRTAENTLTRNDGRRECGDCAAARRAKRVAA